MTNAEKYLKDNVSVEELIKQLYEVQDNNYNTNMVNCKEFFEEEVIPTLTEDERVILEFIANFDYIGRNEKGLYYKLQDADIKEKTAVIYTPTTNLFQFIKERRRI